MPIKCHLFIAFNILLLILLLSACGSSKKDINLTPERPAENFIVGIVVLDSIPDEIKAKILKDVGELPSISLLSGVNLENWLNTIGLHRGSLFEVKSIRDYRDITQLDYLFVFVKDQSNVVV